MTVSGSATHNVLRRYTNLPALLYLLSRRKLTLLSPASWDDRNDAHFIEEYQKRRGLKSVLALCFTQESETYHHWKVFAPGSSGVCIQFRRAELLAALPAHLTCRDVDYRTIDELVARRPAVGDLPFLKRHPFRDENEFRAVYEDEGVERTAIDFDIPLSTIRRVTLNPWIAKPLHKSAKELIRSIKGCSNLAVTRTTLVDNERWKRSGSPL